MTGVKSPFVMGNSADERRAPAAKEMSDLGIEVWR